jgi:hypothetical protein
MTPDDIRELNLRIQENILKAQTVAEQDAGFRSLALSIATEFVAQVAEIGESLRKISSPPQPVNAESPWVHCQWKGRKCVIHKDEVGSVFQYGTSLTESVIVRRGDVGEDAGTCCEFSFSEACAKFGIPYKEPA